MDLRGFANISHRYAYLQESPGLSFRFGGHVKQAAVVGTSGELCAVIEANPSKLWWVLVKTLIFPCISTHVKFISCKMGLENSTFDIAKQKLK